MILLVIMARYFFSQVEIFVLLDMCVKILEREVLTAAYSSHVTSLCHFYVYLRLDIGVLYTFVSSCWIRFLKHRGCFHVMRWWTNHRGGTFTPPFFMSYLLGLIGMYVMKVRGCLVVWWDG